MHCPEPSAFAYELVFISDLLFLAATKPERVHWPHRMRVALCNIYGLSAPWRITCAGLSALLQLFLPAIGLLIVQRTAHRFIPLYTNVCASAVGDT